jgi:hypothetical protein
MLRAPLRTSAPRVHLPHAAPSTHSDDRDPRATTASGAAAKSPRHAQRRVYVASERRAVAYLHAYEIIFQLLESVDGQRVEVWTR